jgi:hypothetical protein
MSKLSGAIARKGLVAVLVAAAALVFAAPAAHADRFRGHSSSGPRHHGGGHPGFHHHHHFSPPRVIVRPAFPRRYYYVPGPLVYRPPVYYAPPPVTYAPPVLPALNNGYLYFCPASQAYYPQVLECTEGWMQVSPGTPPPG